MARYDDEDKAAFARELPEPMHERVAVLEKRERELEGRVEELGDQLRGFMDRVARELNL